jgi:hypothetical protein
MSNNTTDPNSEFKKLINQIRNDTGKRLLNKDELLFLTADEIAHSFTMNEMLLHNRNQPDT